jgi:hypothetical protein
VTYACTSARLWAPYGHPPPDQPRPLCYFVGKTGDGVNGFTDSSDPSPVPCHERAGRVGNLNWLR